MKGWDGFISNQPGDFHGRSHFIFFVDYVSCPIPQCSFIFLKRGALLLYKTYLMVHRHSHTSSCDCTESSVMSFFDFHISQCDVGTNQKKLPLPKRNKISIRAKIADG